MNQLLFRYRGKKIRLPYHIQRLEPHPMLEGVVGLVTFVSMSDDMRLPINDELSDVVGQISEAEEIDPHRHRFFRLAIMQTDGRPNGCFEFEALVTEFRNVGRPLVSFTRTTRCPDEALTAFAEFLPPNPYQVGIPHGGHDPWSAAG
ncbi:MAG: hypothetical protein HYY50_05490 [Candidatus Kerfeldbacteria bacterium]|nr:hypothetical protein [Candidatus Kerfeldbacteria bacterium]